MHEAGVAQPIGRTAATEVQVAGAVDIHHGEMLLGNGSTITAGAQPVKVVLSRGGQIRLCSTTSLHLANDRSIADPQNTALMMALDRGALEVNYSVGKYSDVLLTPDLRILISGPGEANLSIRLNTRGDTCVDNHGADAPYVTVSSQLEGGAYRVQPNQRVTFENGGLREVVDNEAESCGCPPSPTVSVADAGASSKNPAHPGQPVGGPSSTPADTAFPLAESEGLAPPPALPTKPIVPAGQAHAEVTVPLIYNGENPPTPQLENNQATANLSATANLGATANLDSSNPQTPSRGVVSQATQPSEAQPAKVGGVPAAKAAAGTARRPPDPPPAQPKGFFHHIGRFFARIFG
jgi:hypothetical protein